MVEASTVCPIKSAQVIFYRAKFLNVKYFVMLLSNFSFFSPPAHRGSGDSKSQSFSVSLCTNSLKVYV